MTQPTAEQIELARECAAKVGEDVLWPGITEQIMDGNWDGDRAVKSALLAIQATEARMAAAVEALTKAAERFREYETSHMRKGSIDGDMKARRNCEMAEMCEAAIRRI